MNPLGVLSEDDIAAVHTATLRVLDEIGVRLSHQPSRDILAGAGARIQQDRVLFSPDTVAAALASCPSQVSLRGRAGKTITLGDGSLQWHNVGGASHVYDPATRARRPATLQDVHDSARLLDALDRVTSITPFFTPQDVPGAVMSLTMYRHSLPYTTKPLQGPGIQTAAEVRFATEMAAVAGPIGETFSLSVSPISPLYFPDGISEAIVEIARRGVPFSPLPCPTAGATAPLSLAGALTQQNAELLACIILAQAVHPGLPIVYCGRLAVMEPRTGVSVWGGVELGLLSAATVRLGHHYNLPVNVYGLSTNANELDLQNGYERALNAVIPAMAGADELSGIGEMAAGVQGSYTQMVLDDELAASINRLRRGMVVDEDSLAFDIIRQAMDGTADFLEQPHTVRYLRSGELFFTKLAERRGWSEWDINDRRGMTERALARSERILASHEVPPLAAEQERELDKIMDAALAELAIA